MSQHYSHGGNNDRNESFGQQNPEVKMYPDQKIISPTTHIFYKTRLCYSFLKGNCRKGDSCTFAHGTHDIRQPSPNWQEFVNDNSGGNGNESWNWNDDQKIIERMRICRNFYYGNECPYGENCSFLHESPAKFKVHEAPMDFGRTRQTTVINIQPVDHGQSQLGPNQVPIGTMNTAPDGLRASVKESYWKTRMCGKWETTGKCAFADNCSFAHGFAELNTPVRRVEREGRVQGHPYARSSVHLKPVHGTTTGQLATGLGNVVRGTQGEHQPRGFLKLANKKLNRIYGDWIDDEEDE